MSESGYSGLLPQEGTWDEANRETMPSLTFQLEEEQGRIRRKIDGIAAIKQSILKRLRTEGNTYPIYGEEYGFSFHDLADLAPPLAESEVKRRIAETLLQDERIASVEEFGFSRRGDALMVSFTVVSADGEYADLEGRIADLA